MRFYLSIFLLLLAPLLSFAQGRDRGNLSFLYEPGASVEGGGQLTLTESRLATGLPPIRWAGNMFNVGFEWSHYDFRTEDTQPDDFDTDSVGLSLRWGFGDKKGWSGSMIFSPSLRSDFETVTTDDLGLAGLALGSYPLRSNLTTVVGLVYSRSFGRDKLFPALGATWKPEPRWQVDLVFPRPRVTYQASAKSRYYIGLEPGGDEWNVELPEGSRDLSLEEYRAGGGAEWMLTRHVGLLAQAGTVFGRELEVHDGRDKQYDYDIGDTWFARIGLLYR